MNILYLSKRLPNKNGETYYTENGKELYCNNNFIMSTFPNPQPDIRNGLNTVLQRIEETQEEKLDLPEDLYTFLKPFTQTRKERFYYATALFETGKVTVFTDSSEEKDLLLLSYELPLSVKEPFKLPVFALKLLKPKSLIPSLKCATFIGSYVNSMPGFTLCHIAKMRL